MMAEVNATAVLHTHTYSCVVNTFEKKIKNELRQVSWIAYAFHSSVIRLPEENLIFLCAKFA